MTESEWLRLEGTLETMLSTPCSSSKASSRLSRTMLKQLVNISKDGDPTAPLGTCASDQSQGKSLGRKMRHSPGLGVKILLRRL